MRSIFLYKLFKFSINNMPNKKEINRYTMDLNKNIIKIYS